MLEIIKKTTLVTILHQLLLTKHKLISMSPSRIQPSHLTVISLHCLWSSILSTHSIDIQLFSLAHYTNSYCLYIFSVAPLRERHQYLKSGSIPNKWGCPDSPQPRSNLVYADTPHWTAKCTFPSQTNLHTFVHNLLFSHSLQPPFLHLTFNLKI